jgi:hypothetical protein
VTIEHKAFVFDDELFRKELEPILKEALTSNDLDSLERFVDKHRRLLKNPYDGQPVPAAWRSILDLIDVHQLGDLALTKYYDPRTDIGLGSRWSQIDDALQRVPERSTIVLGRPVVGGTGVTFDPGKMGSYLQTASDVQKSIATLKRLGSTDDEVEEEVAPLIALLEHAAKAGRGLYTTF